MTYSTCMISDCPGDVRARGVCAKHYKVWQRHGNAAHVATSRAEKTTAPAWRRFGADGQWSTDLEELDRLAVIGASRSPAPSLPQEVHGLDESNSHICRGCYPAKPRDQFYAHEGAPRGRLCQACRLTLAS